MRYLLFLFLAVWKCRHVLFAFIPGAFVAEQAAHINVAFIIVHIFQRNVAAQLWAVALGQVFELFHHKAFFLSFGLFLFYSIFVLMTTDLQKNPMFFCIKGT